MVATFHGFSRRRPSSTWREQAETELLEIQLALPWISDSSTVRYKEELVNAVEQHLAAAEAALKPAVIGLAGITGAASERTFGSLDSASTAFARLMPDEIFVSYLPNFLQHVERFLPKDDYRTKNTKDIAEEVRKRKGETITVQERHAIIAARQGALIEARKQQIRLRSWRNLLLLTALVAFVISVGLAIMLLGRPALIPTCFTPDEQGVVCPTKTVTTEAAATPAEVEKAAQPFDAAMVEGLGLLGATVAAATSIKNMRTSEFPYSLAVALAFLKLPLGALTAFLGLQLIRAGFVPGFSAIDSSAQILAWAIVLGFAQQLFTRLVDQQANSVLESITPDNSANR
jgi:hypothetical protein